MNKTRKLIAGAVAIATLFAASWAVAQLSTTLPPTDSKGINTRVLGTIDLGPEFEGMAGRQLRMRLVTIEPGGYIGIHKHEQRPAIEFVFSGNAIEHVVQEVHNLRGGDVSISTTGKSHWWENKGETAAVFVVGDILKP